MTSSDPSASAPQEISREERSTWTVQAGADGKWIDVSTPTPDHEEAVAMLAWRRSVAQPSVTYRLVRDTTVHTRTVESIP
ncbi:hypothetical protein [Streptomyces sp. SAI-090]|jgi:hypothetical protein|uniref:hypothetical protein n=1 Tax=Streptomyces sp. SAI-090 TaxID=2940545 RepID=UPI002474D9C1|nr:hypothetical protein [Streptomyces sp. SAI-090]MDH6522037.1 hypothetical protein [Streptomyces sp. SAI-090]